MSEMATGFNNQEERQRFYIAAVEASNHAFLTTTPDGAITAWNHGAERLFGYSADEAIGQPISIIIPEDRRAESRINRDQLCQLKRISSVETVRIDKRGRRIDVVLELSPIFSASGSFVGMASIIRDVTEEKLAQEMFRLAVEACPSGMVMIDRTGTILMVNGEIERLFGYSRHELINKSIDMLVPERLRLRHARHREAFKSNPAKRAIDGHRDLLGRRKDGTEFAIEVGLNPIQIRDGLLVLSVIIDISERRRLERLKDEFVSTVSHELRTPLTSIAGSLGLLAGGAGGQMPEATMRLLRIAHSNSERLVRLINDFLDLEKIESGNVVLHLKPLDVRALVEQAIEANRGFAAKFAIEMKLDPDSVSAFVLADNDRLVQVVTNLLSNAIKSSPSGQLVVVTTEHDDAFARIIVRDHGPGIPDEFKRRVFEKFAQANTMDERQKGGTGLGLSIVKQLVTLLGGSVWFESPADGGTSFHVQLPRVYGMAEGERPRADRMRTSN
jgi:PAS domain S-box-containing protein